MRHLVLVVIPLLLACPFEEHWPDPVPDPDAEDVPLEWGTVADCDVGPAPGYADFYVDGEALLVHGSSPGELELATEMRAFYGAYLDSFELREGSALSDADRELDLFILGTASSNPLLQELNGSLPVWFEDDRFTFGRYRWEEPGHGISLIHPNPWAPGRYLTLYSGNTLDGAASTFTVPTGARDYVTTRGGWTLQLEGDLCRTGELWAVDRDLGDDLRAPWDAWTSSLDSVATEHHVFLYVAGSEAAGDIETLAPWQTGEHERALELMDVAALDTPIRTYLYPDNTTKGEMTGNPGNGHANSMNFEVHEVYGDGVHAVGAHEDVHVIAWHRIGDTAYPLMGEGLAVWVNGPWWGEELEHWMVQYRDSSELPTLQELIDSFWTVSDGITYPVAGHFVAWLEAEHGIEAVKDLYVAEDLEQALASQLGMSLVEIEAAWLATLP